MSALELQSWLGRSESASEPVSPWRAGAMAAVLDRAAPASGSRLPTLWHWIFCATAVSQARLAADGHPERGDFIPPVPQALRMWAGSKLEFLDEIRIGDTLSRESRIVDIRETSGNSGEMVFVTLENSYGTGRGLAVRERQDIVYRHRPEGSYQAREREPIAMNTGATRTLCPDERMLFRYSALTFNAHRIHYDLPYAQDVEGYPGLLVHGPLLATLLLDLWQENPQRPEGGPGLRSLEIRALGPAFAGKPLQLCIGEPVAERQTLWAQQQSGSPLLRIDLEF